MFRLRLASGYEVDATANHPFRTREGWTRLDQLSVGSCLAVPRRLPAPVTSAEEWAADELVLLARDRRLPEPLHGLPAEQIALFLGHLWATHGTIARTGDGRGAVVGISFRSPGRALVDGVRRLLLRLDIRSRLTRVAGRGDGDGWHLDVSGSQDRLRFLEVVGCPGERSDLPACRPVVGARNPQPNVDPLPRQRELVAAGGRRGAFAQPANEEIGLSARSESRAGVAASDVCWDEVVEITPLGEQPTFDATVEGTHNFVANGVIAHNSIEQDADLVMFLYRDEYYTREKSEKPGIAEIILAKHRNGPTGMIELVFRGSLTRFENKESRRPEFEVEP